MNLIPVSLPLSLLLLAPPLLRSHAEDFPKFCVSGTVTHRQFGTKPFEETYQFSARSDGCSWSISSTPESPGSVKEFIAVGNQHGVFITTDMSDTARSLRRSADPPQNDSTTLVSNVPVPNSLFAPPLGPVWLTYLSACFLANATSNQIPPPTSFGVAGTSPIPPFVDYTQKSFWRLRTDTKLPDQFISVDTDGHIKGILGGHLVKSLPYPAPFDKGLTNILFTSSDFVKFGDFELPRTSTLEVFWLSHSLTNIEKVQTYTIKAKRFDPAPATPIPTPTPRGVALVADWRLSTTNGPVILHYSASNSFLETSALSNLPTFNLAVRESLTRQVPVFSKSGSGPRIFLLLFVLLAALPLFALLLRKHRSKHQET